MPRFQPGGTPSPGIVGTAYEAYAAAPVQYASAPVTYAAAPAYETYAAAPVQYAPAPVASAAAPPRRGLFVGPPVASSGPGLFGAYCGGDVPPAAAPVMACQADEAETLQLIAATRARLAARQVEIDAGLARFEASKAKMVWKVN